jgi:hypothetical protein
MKINRIAPISIVFVRSAIIALTLVMGVYLQPGIGSLFTQGRWTAEVWAQEVGVLHVTITPQEAIDAGAQWRVDGGIWRNSGVSLGIEAGNHTVGFKVIDGWDAPADILVTIIADAITEATGTYTLIRSLRVFITPAGAIDAGAQWNVDGGSWQDSGTIVADLSVGDHAVNYKDVFGWSAPPSETVTIVAGQISETTGNYTQLFGSLQVFITPQSVMNEGAQWKVDDGYWQQSGTTISDLPAGEHTVVFKGVFGWTRPPDQTVTVYDSQVTSTTGNYAQISTGVTRHVPSEYLTIQAAINAASDGDTILVADGTYLGLWNKDLDFNGKAIKVAAENGPGNCIIDCEGSGRGFSFHSGENNDSVVSGFTAMNGRVDDNGGGIYCSSSSPKIMNCTISGNNASGLSDGFGGGIYCHFSSPIITNCTISGNRAASGMSSDGFGGGIYCHFSSPIITNCTISWNNATSGLSDGFGGGIYCHSSSPSITECTISGNSAIGSIGGGGGIYCSNSSSPTIMSCTISGNRAASGSPGCSAGGGGIYCNDSSSPVVSRCKITRNFATAGGGIHCSSSSPLITNCFIYNNNPTSTSTVTASFGGKTPSIFPPRGLGGGISCRSSSPTIMNCTIMQNFAHDYEPDGGGLYSDSSSSPTITNSIFWHNFPNEILGDSNTTYSDIEGGYSGLGNIDTDPMFVDPDKGDYRLSEESPCIDTGTSEGAPATDIEGTPRPQGAGFDMGAYEFGKKIVYVSQDGLCYGNTPCYSTIQEGIDWDGIAFTVKAHEGPFAESIVLDEDKKITFQSGWDTTFTTNIGGTQITSMTISNGTILIDKNCLVIGGN